MVNQIECPHCKKVISNNSIIDDVARGSGSDTQSLVCECGERITYWQIDEQLRKQKTFSKKFQNGLQNLFHR